MLSKSYYVLNGNDMIVYVGSKARCRRILLALKVGGDDLARLCFGLGRTIGHVERWS